ncbi:leucine-rich_repeat domain-containing protein [Hexamita inflata]|uniref:Leucine-rich repeat domain-containing protein n=1 Tax=Hexamita inflata TaxID=28002 RepID=A0AA86QM27_9EUKA|nr:leucine-rich repeat domain-containing protein [Hexamita inflata]
MNFSQNQICNIISLESIQNVTKLDLSYNRVLNITALKNLSNLIKLNLSFNEIKDISPLRYFKKLTCLNISKNKLINIEALRGLNNIQQLDISKNSIVYVYPLQNLNKLKQISISENKILDLEILDKFPQDDLFGYFDQIYFDQIYYIFDDIDGQPSAQDRLLLFANKARAVDLNCLTFQKCHEKLKNLKQTVKIFNQKITQTIKKQTFRQIQFTQDIINLFEVLNRQNSE